nr:MAG TPA: hypothetical protein [Caudoviricetes sp.]
MYSFKRPKRFTSFHAWVFFLCRKLLTNIDRYCIIGIYESR